MQEFLELFDSEESVERDYLKNILHKLYAKVNFTLKYNEECIFWHKIIILRIFKIVGAQKKNDKKSY